MEADLLLNSFDWLVLVGAAGLTAALLGALGFWTFQEARRHRN